MKWQFNELTQSVPRNGSPLSEFFKNDFFNSFTDALIREDVQNRLDAKRDDVPEDDAVHIRYYLSTKGTCTPTLTSRWFDGLEPHCNAKRCCEDFYRDPLDVFKPRHQFRFLTIECTNTTGLKGDPQETNEDIKGIEDNDFYWMFRNSGRSGKPRQKGKRGSWGVGKIVYHLASEASTFFCYSVSEEGTSLMGKSQLSVHSIRRKMYWDVGYFANFIDGDFAVPETRRLSTVMKQFRSDFNITRGNNELGTSTVIPFCTPSVTHREIVKSVIRSYLWELLKGHVEIKIETDEGKAPITLNKDVSRIKFYIECYFSAEKTDKQNIAAQKEQEKQKFLDFADFFAAVVESQNNNGKIREFDLKVPDSFANILKYSSLFKSADEFNDAKKIYDDGGIVAVKANVNVGTKTPRGDRDYPASFMVYLQRGSGDNPEVSFIRDGLTILNLEGHRTAPFCGLTLIESLNGKENPLSNFVRAAENPSHTALQPSRDCFKNVYSFGANALLKYVKDLMWNLSAELSDVSGKEDEAAFDDIFDFVEDFLGTGEAETGIASASGGTSGNNQPGGKTKKKGNRKKNEPVVPKLERKRSFFRIVEPWDKGVKVMTSESPAGPSDLPWRLQLKLAFAAEGLKAPLKKYDLSDFDCRQSSAKHVTADCVGCKIVKDEPNRLVFEVTSSDFSIELTGFGQSRDIYVEAKKISQSQVDDDGSVNDNDESVVDENGEEDVE